MKIRTVLLIMLGVYLFSLAFYYRMSLVWSDVDIPLHLLGGFLAGCLGIACWQWVRAHSKTHGVPAWAVAIGVVCFGITIAVFWEFYEFIVDAIYVNRGSARAWMQPSIADTMLDLFMGFLGATAAVLSQWKKLS